MEERGRPPEWETVWSEPGERYVMFRVRRSCLRSPRDGTEHRFDLVETSDAVVVVALTAGSELLLVEQYRPGIERRTLELPGGILEGDQSPEEGARRELREETGYSAATTEILGTLTLNPSFQTTRVHVVRALGCRPAGEKDLDEGEDTRVHLIPAGGVAGALTSGRLDSAVAVAAIALHHLSDGESS